MISISDDRGSENSQREFPSKQKVPWHEETHPLTWGQSGSVQAQVKEKGTLGY